jgi:hypothetical protein
MKTSDQVKGHCLVCLWAGPGKLMQISMPYVVTIVGYENVSVLVWLGWNRSAIGVKK